jgi:hypothetical protein
MCIYFDILLYDVLQFLHVYRGPSMMIDALVYVSIRDTMVEVACSFWVPHTQVCVTFDKFTIVIFYFLASSNL